MVQNCGRGTCGWRSQDEPITNAEDDQNTKVAVVHRGQMSASVRMFVVSLRTDERYSPSIRLAMVKTVDGQDQGKMLMRGEDDVGLGTATRRPVRKTPTAGLVCAGRARGMRRLHHGKPSFMVCSRNPRLAVRTCPDTA